MEMLSLLLGKQNIFLPLTRLANICIHTHDDLNLLSLFGPIEALKYDLKAEESLC